MKAINYILVSVIVFLTFSSHYVVNHKRFNYYLLDKYSVWFIPTVFSNTDTINEFVERLNFQEEIEIKSNKLFISIEFSGKPLLDKKLNVKFADWGMTNRVFPRDTITNVHLIFYIKKEGLNYNIPYKFISSFDSNFVSYSFHNAKNTVKRNKEFGPSYIPGLQEFKALYNSRDSMISYASLGKLGILCELDLSNINFENLNKDKLVADFIIEFTNGRKLAIKQTISIVLK